MDATLLNLELAFTSNYSTDVPDFMLNSPQFLGFLTQNLRTNYTLDNGLKLTRDPSYQMQRTKIRKRAER
jgi:hypothetical protein